MSYKVLPPQKTSKGQELLGAIDTVGSLLFEFVIRTITEIHAQTRTAILTFVLAMVLHPAVYAKAQEEVDLVIGDTRLPTIDDRSRLPYIDSVLWEVYRYVPAPPRSLTQCITHSLLLVGIRLFL